MIGLLIVLSLLLIAVPSIQILWAIDENKRIQQTPLIKVIKQHITSWCYYVTILWLCVACGVCLSVMSQLNTNYVII